MEVSLACVERVAIFVEQMLQRLIVGVDVFNGFVDTILTNILSIELIATALTSGKWDSVVHVINILFSPVSEVTNEAIVVVPLWQINS